MKLTLKPSKQTLLHIALFLLVAIFWSCIEILGPIIQNAERSLNIIDIIRVIFHTLFHAGLIFTIISIFGKRSFRIMILATCIYSVFAYMNLLYYRAFGAYFPFNMLNETQQLDGLSNSILALIKWYDITYIITIIVFIYLYQVLSTHFHNFSIKKHIFILVSYLTLTFFPVYAMITLLNWEFGTWRQNVYWQCISSPIKCYQAFGLISVISYQLWNDPAPSIDLTQEESQEIESHISILQKRFINSTMSRHINPRKNIVILLMESLNSECINKTYMPTLDSLNNLSTTLSCLNVNKLVQGGISIGGQLTIMTGLNGLIKSTFCADYPHNAYPSIASLLEHKYNNTHSFTIISTVKHFWRQDKVNNAFDIDYICDKNDGMTKHNQNRWADDKEVINCTLKNIPTDNRPFCALIVPSNMHAPYTYDATIDCNITFENITDPALHEYMRRARYLDDQIATFVQELKNKGLYDDTLIVVTSDHQVPEAYCSDAMKESLSPYIPAIFINTGADWTEQNKRNKDVVFCHSQVYPTMLQLMGLRPEKYAGLFPPMTNIEATKEYDFDNCDYTTTTDERLKHIYDLEELIIRSSYFGTMK